MPVGLLEFITGRTSAINQLSSRANAQNNQASAYIQLLNAFNQGQNTQDSLEVRAGFQNQPQGTSILDRFDNFAASSTNPFAVNQAIVQRNALTPLLAQNAIGNPGFAQSQGLPNTVQGNIGAANFGIQPILTQQYNNQLNSLLATNNPGLNPASVQGLIQNTIQQQFQNQQQQIQNTEAERLRQENAKQQQTILELQQNAIKQQNLNASSISSAAPPVGQGQGAFRLDTVINGGG